MPFLGEIKGAPDVDVCVIGGGLAGLYIANELVKGTSSPPNIRLLESAPSCGGRIRSVYDETTLGKSLLYESGPWRIPSEHHRVIKLFKEHRILLKEAETPVTTQEPGASEQGLSIWESNALHLCNPLQADYLDLATGYANETDAAAGSSPYITNANKYFVAPSGFTSLVESLVNALTSIQLETKASVSDVVRHPGENSLYTITYLKRSHTDTLERKTITAQTLFVCVPPSSCASWTIFRRYARAQMAAVKPGCLNHIYLHPSRLSKFHYKSATSLLGQSVGDQYREGYFQASYSSGRLARMWYNLRLSNPVRYLNLLQKRLFAELGLIGPLSEHNVASHFWEHAYHMWLPTPSFDMKTLVQRCVTPNQTHLPSVFVAGEAFSSYQAWMEGAIETADLALKQYRSGTKHCLQTHNHPDEQYVIVEGRKIDVATWSLVHPGSKKALLNHLQQDVTDLMDMSHHSQNAWAQVLSLQVGWENIPDTTAANCVCA